MSREKNDMKRSELKVWLENWLEERPWDSGSVRQLKCSKQEIHKRILESTDYLLSDCKITERIYHIINDLIEIPLCPICKINHLKMETWVKAYPLTCFEWECRIEYKRRDNDSITGLNGLERAQIKINQIKNKIIGEDGLTISQRAALKTAKTRSDDIDPSTGLSSYQRGGLKMVETRRKDIDPITGLDNYERSNILKIQTMKADIDENGKNAYDRCIRKGVETRAKTGNYTTGFSNECYMMIKNIIEEFKLEEKSIYELYYGDKEGDSKQEWTNYINHEKIQMGAYDFVVRLKDSKQILLVIEYHGSVFHINKEKYNLLVEEDKDDTDPFGNSLRRSYERDQIKKQHMVDKYGCEYLEVFDYDWKENKEEILDRIGNILI